MWKWFTKRWFYAITIFAGFAIGVPVGRGLAKPFTKEIVREVQVEVSPPEVCLDSFRVYNNSGSEPSYTCPHPTHYLKTEEIVYQNKISMKITCSCSHLK